MLKRASVLLSVLLLLFLSLPALAGKTVYDASGSPQTLMVAAAVSVDVDGDMLTLSGVPAVVWFSDRPARRYGHMDLQEFVQVVSGHAALADPPNAALSVLGEQQPVILELLGVPVVNGDVLRWKIRVLEGALPRKAGAASLFIDAFPTQVNN